MMKVKMFGTKATRAALVRLEEKGYRAANRVTVDMSEEIIWRVVDSIRGGAKTGRVYRRTNPVRTHQASAPGQAPADDLGTLAGSYNVVYTKLNQYVFSATVGSDLFYARKLEFGDGKILPRPHFEPAIEEAQQLAGSIITNAWNVS